MTPERWRQIEELYHAARESLPIERMALLAAADPELRHEVELLLAQDGSDDKILDRPAFDLTSDSTVRQLTPGTLLGPYQIEARIGAGGMGEVFRAKDTRLHRTVAIKILSREATVDPQRKRRFLQEARAASALNHPGIVTLHDIASDGGIDYLVMEYVPGKSLDRLIPPKGLPLSESLAFASQIAGALAAAHSTGIVHRDIKPANVIITPESQVRVLDFGLAKLAERSQGDETETATSSETLTEAGTLLGTAAYMSPEQASMRPVDYRTDIFSLGTVLYEMIAGKRPFRGNSHAETMHAIINSPYPQLERQPPELNEILDKALAKQPGDRYQHAGDLALDLRRLSSGFHTKSLPSMRPSVAPRVRRSLVFSLVAAGVVTGAVAGWYIGRQPASGPSLRLDASLINLATYTGTERSGAISPDGKLFAFVSNRGGQPDIWVRQIAGGDPVQITQDQATEFDLVYAPDGESIYYSTAGTPSIIWRVGVLGGTPRKIAQDARYPAPSPDGTQLAYVTRDGISVARADGTSAVRIAALAGVQSPRWSPDGRWLAYTAGSLFDAYQIHIIDPQGRHQKSVTGFKAGFIWCTGWRPDSQDIIFAYSTDANFGDLMSVSVRTGEMRRLTLVPKGLFTTCGVSADGKRLVGTIEEQDWEIWKAPLESDPDSNGKMAVRLLDNAWQPMWTQVPRAGMLLFNSPATGIRNLWIMSLVAAGAPRQVTFDASARISHAALSPDGARVAYVSYESAKGQIWIANADGSGARQLTNTTATNFWPFWSHDGEWVAFASKGQGAAEIWKVLVAGGIPVQVTHGGGFRGDWSPDGNRIAYDVDLYQGSVREGDSRPWLAIAEASTGKVLQKLPRGNFTSPVWSPDGKRLSATAGNSVWLIDPESGETRLTVRFSPNFVAMFRAAWTPDGKSVIVNRRHRVSRIVLMENFWTP